MQCAMTPIRYLCAVTILTLLLCTGITGAALSDHPVVSGISGPNNLEGGYGATGSYVFMATVSGGSPPYTYKWMNPPGIKTLYEGKQYSTVTIPAEQLYTSGTPRYGVWLTVTDSAGKDALWQRDGGLGSSNQFFYGMDFVDYPEPKWSLITEPKTFQKAVAAPVAKVTTPEGCKDSGVRFTGISGQVEVFSECTGGNIKDPNAWGFAKRERMLYVDDHIKTGEDSSAILGFADMSTFVVKQESEIVLASPPDRDSKVKLVAGNIWTNFKNMLKGGTMEIEMNQAIAGAKGTTFICSSDGKQSTVQMIEGTVEVTGKADGKKVMITGGQQVTATSTGLGTPAPFDATAAQAEWSAVQAKAASGIPAPTPATTKKSGLESLLVIAALSTATAGIALRRK